MNGYKRYGFSEGYLTSDAPPPWQTFDLLTSVAIFGFIFSVVCFLTQHLIGLVVPVAIFVIATAILEFPRFCTRVFIILCMLLVAFGVYRLLFPPVTYIPQTEFREAIISYAYTLYGLLSLLCLWWFYFRKLAANNALKDERQTAPPP